MNVPSTRIARLKAEIAAGRVVILTGTGVSVAACGNQEIEGHKVATWQGLLEHGAHHLKTIAAADDKVVTLLMGQIQSGETDLMIAAAETIERRMRAKSDGTFRGWLKDTIGQLTIQDRAILDAIGALPGVLATLNYDHLLERATGRQAVDWKEPDAVQEALCGDRSKILHLHGHCGAPESVVLGVSAYNAVKNDPHAESVLRGFFIDRTVLFIGCGDTVQDPNFSQLIAWGEEALKDVAPRHVLLCRASEVAAFQEKLSAAPWLQPLAYGEAYGDLVPFLNSLAPPAEDWAARGRPPAPPISSVHLAAYRQAMSKQYGRLKLEDLEATSSDMRQLRVTGLFIDQNARECREFLPRALELPKEQQRRLREQGALEGGELDEDTLDRLSRTYLDQSPRPILEVVEEPSARKLVVLGDPGSGKSLLLQYLVLSWAEQAGPAGREAPLPLLIELRDYARLRHQGEITGFLAYLQRAESLRWRFDADQLDQWLRLHPSRVMFDGLDEVFDPELRRELATAIHRFADDYPAAQIVVSSRVIGFQHQSWRDEGFRLFMLQELDAAQRETFLRRWHQVAYDDAAKAESKRALLTDAIARSPAIDQLAGNPLLLTLMAILNRSQELPRDRSELYNQCARLLLHQWKTDDAFAMDPELAKASLDYKDKRRLLMQVAWSLQASPKGLAGNLMEESQLERTLAEGLEGFQGLRAERAARALIEQLRGRNFMLCAVGSGNYAFVHRTFLEYFCAIAIVDRFESKQTLSLEQLKSEIFGHWPDETWHEVLTLVAGEIEPKFLKDILHWLLEQPDQNVTCEHLFLAARCVGEVRRRSDLGVADSLILQKLKDLTCIDYDYFAFKHLRQVVDLGSPQRHRLPQSIYQRAVALIYDVWQNNPQTRGWLQARAQSPYNCFARISAIQELTRGWKDDPEILALLKTLAQSDEHFLVRQSAIQELARGWKDHPDTISILKICAQFDEAGEARQSALQALARGWKEDPDTLRILKIKALSDESSEVRQGVLQELARGWKAHPETQAILKISVQSDGNPEVRQLALEELVRGWREDPANFTMVRTCAQSDESSKVRQGALQELGREWKAHPQTVAILKNSIRSDEDPSVRQRALVELVRGWKSDPDTQVILKSLAKSDKSPAVRLRALVELVRGWKSDPDTLDILKILAESDESSEVRQNAVQERSRGWQDDTDTLPWLRACATNTNLSSDVRTTALSELANYWHDGSDTYAIIKALAQSDQNADVRYIATKELVRSWIDCLDTLTILKALSQSDADHNVRHIAIEGLSRSQNDDTETFEILISISKTDNESYVRRGAMMALARKWHNKPDTYNTLKFILQTDKCWVVRTDTLQELAHGWQRDAETFTILTTSAQSDDNPTVRCQAIEEIVFGWRSNPESLTLLKNCAQADDEWSVRNKAKALLALCWADSPEILAFLQSLKEPTERPIQEE